MAAVIEQEFGLETELVPGETGAFEIRADGELLYSKLRTGRFPEDEEALDLLRD